jgi:peptidoglycan/xylan/chitin deacetylase (PgdA/CDA1 family)
MRVGALLCLSLAIGFSSAAVAADCPGHPDAIGTSRVLVVDPTEHARIGTMQYHETLPLADHEVVLTFDDGPLPPYSRRILEILNAQCVKATYFIVGRMARAYPEVVREIHAAGHTVGTHSQTHPYSFPRMTLAKAQAEVDTGIDSVAAALGDANQIAPFFRIPGLARGAVIEQYLASKSIMTWSADFPADDWRHISAGEVMHRALSRLEAHGKGVLLLHDIQPATVIALPGLLRELKKRGYHIVQVVPASATLPKTPTVAAQWQMNGSRATPADVPPAAATIDAEAPAVPAAAALAPASPAPAAPAPAIAAPAAPSASPSQNAAVVPAAPSQSQSGVSQVVQPQVVPAQAVPTQALPSPTAPPTLAQPQIAPAEVAPPEPAHRRVAAAQAAKPKRAARGQIALPPVARSPRHLGPPTAVVDPSPRPRTPQSFGSGATLPSAAADGHVLELHAPAASSAAPTDVTGSIGANPRPSASVPNAAPR